MLVEEEIYNFDIADLVAECGGSLGLFVGFNFLMVWDFLVRAVMKIIEYCQHAAQFMNTAFMVRLLSFNGTLCTNFQ